MNRNIRKKVNIPPLTLNLKRHSLNFQGGEPCRVGVAVTDIMTGLYTQGAIIAAIFERMKPGNGKRIHTSLLQTQVTVR